MKKVVYSSVGCFMLSRSAVALLLSNGFPLRAVPLEDTRFTERDFPLKSPDGIRAHKHPAVPVLFKNGICYDADNITNDHALRSHPLLVQVVETLGEYLDIEVIGNAEFYRISYDGNGRESVRVLTPNAYVFGHTLPEQELPLKEAPEFARPDELTP